MNEARLRRTFFNSFWKCYYYLHRGEFDEEKYRVRKVPTPFWTLSYPRTSFFLSEHENLSVDHLSNTCRGLYCIGRTGVYFSSPAPLFLQAGSRLGRGLCWHHAGTTAGTTAGTAATRLSREAANGISISDGTSSRGRYRGAAVIQHIIAAIARTPRVCLSHQFFPPFLQNQCLFLFALKPGVF